MTSRTSCFMLTRIAARTHPVWTGCSFRNACLSLAVRALYLIFFKGCKGRRRQPRNFRKTEKGQPLVGQTFKQQCLKHEFKALHTPDLSWEQRFWLMNGLGRLVEQMPPKARHSLKL